MQARILKDPCKILILIGNLQAFDFSGGRVVGFTQNKGEVKGLDFRPNRFVERHSARAPAPQRLSRSCGEELVPEGRGKVVSSGLSFLSPRNLTSSHLS